jgi:sugar lactone lactonase YvrE
VGAITVFARDAATGRLTPLAGAAGCMRADHAGCTPVSGLDAPSGIAISPDGTSLYATSSAGALTSFRRDVVTGTLAQLAPGSGCLSDVPLGDCGVADGLARASAVAVAPDGATVVTTAIDDDAVLTFHRDPATGALTRVACVTALTTIAGCVLSTLIDGPRALAIRPDSHVVWVASSRADAVVTLQLDAASGGLVPTAGNGGCLRIRSSLDCRAARSLDDPRGLAVSPDGLRVFAVGALSDGIAVLGPQLAPNCLPIRARTIANRARSVVLACSDPNGDPVALTILKPPLHGRLGARAAATGSILYTPAPGYAGPDSFTFQASDGMDVSAPGIATVSVTLPAQAPAAPIRTGRTHLVAGSHINVRVQCPAVAIGPCRIATHLLIKGRSAGYGFARLARRTTGRITLGAGGVRGRTKAVVVVTMRDKTRRATVSRRTILILP